ncbi:transglutaminase-like domain-containing protein [Myxococcota bacterium]|nr:transglutaminase-like domain-containing protein [Myxococcota bacterium]
MPRSRPTPLFVVEVLGLLAFLVLAVAFALDHRQGRGAMVPLDVQALAAGPARERWMGIFFEDQKVGYAVSRSSPTADGGNLLEGRSRFRLAAFGTIQDVITAQAALTDAQGALRRFDFFMVTDQVRLSARGEVRGQDIVMEVDNGGEVSTLTFPVEEPPHVQLSLEQVIAREQLAIGKRFEVPFFSPATMAQGTIVYTVEDVEILENGEEAWWVRTSFDGVEARELVTTAGETIRQESALGMSMVRMTADEAQQMPTSDQAVDIIAKSAVKLVGHLPDARGSRRLELVIQGVPPERVFHQPPQQVRTDDRVVVDMPLLAELPRPPVRPDPAVPLDPSWIEATATIQAAHPDIQEKARAIVGDAPDRVEAVRRLNAWVFDYVEKVPTFGVPSGLEVLQTARGDCNEHSALFVSLARSVGIPTRIAAGVVYSDRVSGPDGGPGAFYYHAWPEVLVGDPSGSPDAHAWLPVDPTFGQVPADATHVKLVEGDLDRQVEILAVMGRLGFVLVEAR